LIAFFFTNVYHSIDRGDRLHIFEIFERVEVFSFFWKKVSTEEKNEDEGE